MVTTRFRNGGMAAGFSVCDHESGSPIRTLEFKARLSDNSLTVPADLARQIPPGEDVAVIVLVGDAGDADWRKASELALLDAYVPEDSIYDTLYAEPDVR